MSEHLPIQFCVTDIADLVRRPLGTCQFTVVHIRESAIGEEVVSQTQKLDFSSAMKEKRDIEGHSTFDRSAERIQIYRITRER